MHQSIFCIIRLDLTSDACLWKTPTWKLLRGKIHLNVGEVNLGKIFLQLQMDGSPKQIFTFSTKQNSGRAFNTLQFFAHSFPFTFLRLPFLSFLSSSFYLMFLCFSFCLFCMFYFIFLNLFSVFLFQSL